MSRKRDTFMRGRAPYQVRSADIEAAKHLRNMAAAYVRGTAGIGDIEVAITEFRAAVALAKATGGGK